MQLPKSPASQTNGCTMVSASLRKNKRKVPPAGFNEIAIFADEVKAGSDSLGRIPARRNGQKCAGAKKKAKNRWKLAKQEMG